MVSRISILLLACALAGSIGAFAQDQPASSGPPPTIVTDRPSVTDASTVIPVGSIQVENGLLATYTPSQRIVDGPESLIRVGLAPKTEFRLTVPDVYDTQTLGQPTDAGFGDMALGVKQQLGPTHGFDVSVVATLSLPTGAQSLSSHGYDPALQLPWSRSLSPKWTVAGMLSLYWPTQGDRRNLTGEPAILVDRQLTSPWSAFIEYAADFSQNLGPNSLLHAGTAFTIAKCQQHDFHAGVGRMAGIDYHFVGFGYSFRFQAFRRKWMRSRPNAG